MDEQLKVLACLPEDADVILKAHIVAHNHSVQRNLMTPSGL